MLIPMMCVIFRMSIFVVISCVCLPERESERLSQHARIYCKRKTKQAAAVVSWRQINVIEISPELRLIVSYVPLKISMFTRKQSQVNIISNEPCG